jgi:hypothetical protein
MISGCCGRKKKGNCHIEKTSAYTERNPDASQGIPRQDEGAYGTSAKKS